MSVFKKKEKASLFQRTIDRLSFKSRKKKDKDKTFTVEVIPQGKNVKPDKASDCEDEIKELEESPKLSPKYPSPPPPAQAPPPRHSRHLQDIVSLDLSINLIRP